MTAHERCIIERAERRIANILGFRQHPGYWQRGTPMHRLCLVLPDLRHALRDADDHERQAEAMGVFAPDGEGGFSA